MSGKNEPHHQAAAAESAAKPTTPEPEASAPEAPESAASPEPAKTAKPKPAEPETPKPKAAEPKAAEPEPTAPESTPAPEAPDAAGVQAAPDTEPTATATAEAEAEAEAEARAANSGKSAAARPSGRPSRGLLAGAAIAGALLVGVPFLVSGALDRSGPGNGGPADRVADAGTVLNNSGDGGAPGVYGSADPAPSSPSPSPSASKRKQDDGKREPKTGAVAAGPVVTQSTEHAPSNPKPSKAPKKKKTPPKPAVTTTVTAAPGTTLFGHASNRCIEMVAHKGADGSPLQIADCTGKNWQKWDFRPDGTIRSMGLCMDVAWGSHDNGAVIQIAWCSGNPAQQFVLSAAHDLVNPQANKCVDVKNAQTGGGARLQLWDCNGRDNQKWSRR
ncbi:RICIN domain-containing protein [Streptomyces sp. SID9124]|uniref:RICIN domain-containing protein n=1 Tax=Streptomyces sp. SID9124 TaxID=2706108 RepID=UPI0013DF5FCF|nr:RICIN domain-containing protein [Streptomyces sp. SID9124]NED15425.1 hydrolytic protein [Streptomyces sp. SID9124]